MKKLIKLLTLSALTISLFLMTNAFAMTKAELMANLKAMRASGAFPASAIKEAEAQVNQMSDKDIEKMTNKAMDLYKNDPDFKKKVKADIDKFGAKGPKAK